MSVLPAVELDYGRPVDDALAPSPEAAVVRTADGARVRLRIREARYTGLVVPRFPKERDTIERKWGSVFREAPGTLRVRVGAAPGRAALVWVDGGLSPLLAP